MNVWNKVFLGVIFVSAIAVVALAAVEFQIRNTGQKHIATLNQRIADTEERIARIVGGTATEPRYEQIRGTLREHLQERGRAWFGCLVASMDEETLPPALQQVITQIIITSPLVADDAGNRSHVAPPDALRGVVYVFSEPNENQAGAFLGRFHVDSEPTPTMFRGEEGNEYAGWRVRLVTSDPINDREIEKIFEASRQQWSVFINPPVDRVAGIFSELTEDEKQMIPTEFWDRFQPRPMPELTAIDTDGVSSNVLSAWEEIRAAMDDPELARDFAMLLDWLYQHRSGTFRAIEVTKSDTETYLATAQRSQTESARLENEDIPLEEKRVAMMRLQRDAAGNFLEQYVAEIARMELLIDKLQALASAYVAQIAEAQILASEKVEENVRSAGR
ncbi:MAG: hypothetical protein FWG73_04165 [Planctomycetaceae bacterium]|nr:hypothetical protein [Planctomycetaceae bacterium]